jgi:hypothetical protein
MLGPSCSARIKGCPIRAQHVNITGDGVGHPPKLCLLLGDERPVGFAVILMRHVQKIECVQFLLRVTHDYLVDTIAG